MQFDFIKRLFGKRPPQPVEAEPKPATAPIPAPPTPASPPVPAPQAPVQSSVRKLVKLDAAPLLVESRRLLAGAGAPALAGRVQVRWNPRMRSTAGMAYPGKSLVTLNPRLLEFGEEEVSRTLRHELAHLLAHERVGRRRIQPHGEEWRQACRDLGLADEKRTHNLPLPRRAIARRHHYRCPGCGITVARVKPLRRESACLKCCRTHNRGRYDARFRFVRVPSS